MATIDDLQMRVEVQDVVEGWVIDMMSQNKIPPHVMEDALAHAQARLAKFVMVEMVNAAMEHAHEHKVPEGESEATPVEGEVIE